MHHKHDPSLVQPLQLPIQANEEWDVSHLGTIRSLAGYIKKMRLESFVVSFVFPGTTG